MTTDADYLESVVESRIGRLERWGFAVYKLKTPGKSGVMDRLILYPKYAPEAPGVVEAKRPGKSERRLQEATRDDWRARGVKVFDMIDTVAAADALVLQLWDEVKDRYHAALAVSAQRVFDNGK